MNKIRILMKIVPPEKARPGKGVVYDTRGICATLITGWSITAPWILETYEQDKKDRILHQAQPFKPNERSGL